MKTLIMLCAWSAWWLGESPVIGLGILTTALLLGADSAPCGLVLCTDEHPNGAYTCARTGSWHLAHRAADGTRFICVQALGLFKGWAWLWNRP